MKLAKKIIQWIPIVGILFIAYLTFITIYNDEMADRFLTDTIFEDQRSIKAHFIIALAALWHGLWFISLVLYFGVKYSF